MSTTSVLVHPLPGTNRAQIRQALNGAATQLGNLRGGGGGNTADRLIKYLEWANDAVRTLRPVVRPDDITRLVLTARYAALLRAAGTDLPSKAGGKVVNDLLNLEFDEQVREFEEAQVALERQISRWTNLAAYIAFDSNVFLHHPSKIRDIDYFALVAAPGDVVDLRGGGGNLHLLIPSAVIAELDRLKESKTRDIRWRAGHTLGVIDELFRDPTVQPQLSATDAGTVTVELLIDPIGHGSLDNTDDEIIDRLLSAQPLANRTITLITYDTHMSTKARMAGLRVIKLQQDFGDEPSPADSNARRSEETGARVS